MPKIVDHSKRREEIAQVACHVVAEYGFEQTTVARIAEAAGYTTGMVAHYYESKQDIILAALRLILTRIEERLNRQHERGERNLLGVLSEALPIDEARSTECAFWMAFWGQVSADKKLRRLNAWVHREYMRLFARCFAEHWPESAHWPKSVRAVTSPGDWPAASQVQLLQLQLALLRQWTESQRLPMAAAGPGAAGPGASGLGAAG